MRRKNSWLLLLFLFLFAFGCSTATYHKIRMELPRKTRVSTEEFDELILTEFYLKNDVEDFDFNQELLDYLSTEMESALDEKISRAEVEIPDETVFEAPDFWKDIAPDTEDAVILGGTAEFSQETRKALIGKKVTRQFDTPFPAQKRLASRKFYTLEMNIHLIQAATGEVLFKQNFKETKGYENPNQTAYFAFFDLIYIVKEKLFRQIVGGERVQERYLIKD